MTEKQLDFISEIFIIKNVKYPVEFDFLNYFFKKDPVGARTYFQKRL